MRTLLKAVLILVPFGIAGAAERNDPLAFEPNRGQTGAAVRYLARTTGVVAFFTDTEVVLGGKHIPLRMQMVGANAAAEWSAEPANGRTTNYLLGRDSAKWVRDVPQYSRLLRRGVYPGVDVAFYGNTGRLEYDFLLAPHASPAAIRLRIAGAQKLRLLPDGSLAMDTEEGSVRQAKPSVYQTRADGGRIAIDGQFRLIGKDTVGFALGPYDPALPLAIDPVLLSFSYIGGIADDRIVSAASSTLFAGTTSSIDFPGAVLGRRNGDDVVVNTGYATYVIGGTGNDEVTAANFGSGTMVVGYTDSTDLPTNISHSNSVTYAPVLQRDFAGGATDGFVLWIDPQPSSYYSGPAMYLSYLGTSGDDKLTAVSANGTGYAIAGSTTGAGLPGPFSNAPAGGADGFVMLLNGFSSNYSTVGISQAVYLGGSGDDTPYGICYANGTYYVTGETASADFPLVNPLFAARGGGTDAFLTQLKVSNGVFQISGSTLLGGSKTDRGVALATNNTGNLVLSGTTSSPDLAVTANAVQSAYGGGASDVFVAQFLPDLSQLVSLTYYGGSGAEEATSIASDYFGSLYVAGWTTSADFPVQNALQPVYGGGPDDGFLLHFDLDGALYEATYFGGNGSDRIYSVSANNDFTVWIAGQTTSTNLTGPSGSGGALYGPSDGFIASIGAPLLAVYPCSGGKGLRADCSAFVAALNGSSTAPLTLTSSDPSRVLIAPDLQSASQASLTVGSVLNYTPGYRPFDVDCLTDNGGADIQVAAAGYPSRVIHVSCYPIQLILSSYYSRPISPGVWTTSLWAGDLKLNAYLAAVNPATGATVTSLSPVPGQSPIAIAIASSNTAAGTVDPGFTIGGTISPGFTFHPVAIGNTVLSFTSPQIDIANSTTVSVVSPISIPSLAIPGGFQTFFGTYSGTPPAGTSATVTSGDPASLVFSLDPQQPGTASVTATLGTDTVYAQALASSGDIPVTLAVDGFAPVTGPVHLAPPILHCYGCASPVSLGLAALTSLSPYIGASGSSTQLSIARNPGIDPVTIALTSSNTAVATVSPASSSMTAGPPSYYAGGFGVTGAGTGSSTLGFQASGGVAVDAGAASFAVNVQKQSLKMAGIDLGKDLAGLMTLSFPSISSAKVTLTVADPTLAVLSLNNSSAGQTQVAYNVVSSGALSFYVYGLASSGQTQVTATVDGYGSISAPVRLGPAGLIWSADSVAVQLYNNFASIPLVETAVLDAATMLPLGTEALRYGVTASAQLQSSDASVVTVPSSLSFSSTVSYSSVSPAFQGAGTASISIVQPTGFSTPAIRESLKVTVQSPSLTLTGFPIGKDTQLLLSYSEPGNAAPVTLTSSDPSKLVLSTDPSMPGSASVTVSGSQQVLAQALDSLGTVQITASAPGYNSATASYSLKGLGVGITANQSAPVSTTTQSYNTPLSLSLYLVDAVTGAVAPASYQAVYRPGVNGPSVTVTSSNTAIGQILQSPAHLGPSNSGSATATVNFMPVAPGDATVAVAQPAGYLTPTGYTSVLFHVTLPSLVTSSLLMGKDTIISLSPSLQANVASPAVNVNVTITSSDPTRLVLSSAADTNTAASITKVLVAGQSYVNTFYAQALDSSGTVTLKVSASGFADAFYTVTLTALRFGFAAAYLTPPVRAVIQKGPQTYGIAFSAVPLTGGSSYYSPVIRPGVNFNLTVATSDSTVLAVDNPTVTIAAGASSASVAARPVAAGLCALTLSAPAGYTADPAANLLVVSVEGAKLSLYGSTVGRDLETSLNVSSEAAFPQATPITIYSTDPSRLLVSADSTTPGAASVAISGTSGNNSATVWVQALADNGVVTLVASADGYQPATAAVTLSPSAAVFGGNSSSQNLYTNSGAQTVGVTLAAVNPVTLGVNYSGMTARPGANLTAAITSSDPNVVSLDHSTLTFSGTNSINVKVTPVGVGSALVTLGPLPVGLTIGNGTEIVYNVTEPDLFVPDLSIGRDLQAAVQLRLASRIPAPANDLTLTIETNSQYTAELSSDPAVAGNAVSIPVVIPAGQHLSKPFYVQGMSQGSTNLYVFGGGFNSSSSNVTVAATGFVFQEAIQSSTLALAPGGSANLTVTPVALPVGTSAPAGMTIRPGVAPIVLTVAHTGNAATVSPSSVTLSSGMASATIGVTGASIGSSVVSLSGPAAYQYPAQASVTVQVQNLGTIQVYANLYGAYFSINGQRNYTSAAAPWAQSEPPGSYTVTFEPISGYTTPASQTLTLAQFGSTSFTGSYVATPAELVCAVTGDSIVSAADIRQMIREALGMTAAPHDLNKEGVVNAVDVQLVVDAVLTLGCNTGQPISSAGRAILPAAALR